jgi:hypothetical protein
MIARVVPSGLALALSCGGGSEPAAPTPAKAAPGDDSRQSSDDPREDPLRPPEWGAPVPFAVRPPLPAEVPGLRPHLMGWSPAGDVFGFCVGAGGDACTRCQLVTRGAAEVEHVDDCVEGTTAPDPARRAALETRLAGLSLAAPTVGWPFPGAQPVWDLVEGKPEEGRAARLRIGAEVDSRVPVYPVNITDEGYRKIWPELIALSPDARQLGIVSHAHEAQGALDSWRLEIVEARELVAAAYNGAGLLLAHNDLHDEAVPMFHRAAHATRLDPWPMYNLACALARLKASGTRAALERAVASGGAAVRQKLATDPDLESVRGEAWFAGL